MVGAKYQYTSNSVMQIMARFNDVLINMTFKGEEMFEKYFKVYPSKRNGYYFVYKRERIYLNQFH